VAGNPVDGSGEGGSIRRATHIGEPPGSGGFVAALERRAGRRYMTGVSWSRSNKWGAQSMKRQGKIATLSGQNETRVEYTLSGHTRRVDAGTTAIPGTIRLQLTVEPMPVWISPREELVLETDDGRRLLFWLSDSHGNVTVGGWME
jgi:hypothetical protein